MRHMLEAGAKMDPAKTDIVDIRFAYYNKDMLKLLAKRGKALRATKFDKMRKYEERMDKLKAKHFNQLTTPNTFYCTFEHASACQQLKKLKSIAFKGQELIFKKPKDPTDVFWTNHGMTQTNRTIRIILFLFFGFIQTGSGLVTSFVSCIDWQ